MIVVAGAAGGLGRAVASECAAAGASLVLVDVGAAIDGTGTDPELVGRVAADLETQGTRAVALALDLTAEDSADRIVETALDSFGRVDGLVWAAGAWRERTLLNLELKDLDDLWRLQVRSAFALVQRIGRAMIRPASEPEGSIVLMTSASAFFGATRQSALSATAAAVVALTRSAAVELRKHRIRVNAIAPTALTRVNADLPTFKGIKPDAMTAAHVARVAALLLGDLPLQVNGEVLGVAGDRVYALRGRETAGRVLRRRCHERISRHPMARHSALLASSRELDRFRLVLSLSAPAAQARGRTTYFSGPSRGGKPGSGQAGSGLEVDDDDAARRRVGVAISRRV